MQDRAVAGALEHHGLRVIDHNLERHPAEMLEGLLVAGEHGVEPLVREGGRIEPPRVTEGEDKHVRRDILRADPHAALTKVHLGLLPRRRLKAHGGPAGLPRRDPQGPDEAVHLRDRARIAEAPELAPQHRAVVVDFGSPDLQPRRVGIEDGDSRSGAPRPPAAPGPPGPHGLRIDLQRPGDPEHRFAPGHAGQDLLHLLFLEHGLSSRRTSRRRG